MMPVRNLGRMVIANTLRSPKHFVLSAFGIVIGIAAFVFFLGLTERVGDVLEKVFPLEQVQVVAPRTSFVGKDTSLKLDDAIVAKIAARPEVKNALPRMNLSFPAFGRGDFQGNDLKFEVGGFADGIDPAFVDDDARTKELFRDWDSVKDDKHRIACVPPPHSDEEVIQSPPAPPDVKPAGPKSSGWGGDPVPAPAPVAPVGSGSGSSAGSAAGSGSATGSASSGSAAGSGSATLDDPAAVLAAVKTPYYNPCPDPDRYYCDDTDRTCHHRVPLVMSPAMIELYNGQFAKSHNLPIVDNDFVKLVTTMGGLSAMRFSIGLGLTTVAGTNSNISKKKARRVEAVLVGESLHAMQIGMTMPIQYIERWNREFLGEEAATAYSSIIVTLADRDRLAPFGQWLTDNGLRLEDSLGERFATVIFVITLLFVMISMVIIVISAINIAHNFFMQISDRRRELGILRAVGATPADIQLVILGEAALIGLIGGVIGVGLAMGAGQFVNWFSAHYLPRFPFKPDSWFAFKFWIWGSGIGFSTLFCVLGGFLPARRAATMPPAQALTAN